jgi:hypothetical protein
VKAFLFNLLILSLFFLSSCEKDKLDSPGNIPGMGSNSDELQIKELYTLPKEISIIGSITEGFDWSLPRYGGGSVHMKITLLNHGNSDRTVFFPKGLIFKCNSPDNHNLMVLQTCWICLKQNSSKTFIQDAYCINHARKHPADPGITFEMLGLSDSQVINNLLDMISWRKINYEMIVGSSSVLNRDKYNEIMEHLMNTVWNLTDKGIDITDENRAFIENIPELSPLEIPQKDYAGQFPDYFDEYVAKGN